MRSEALLQAIIIQAIKDYWEGGEEVRRDVTEWVKKKNGTFIICATSWDKTPDELQKFMFDKMKEIDNGGSVFRYKVNYTNFRRR